MVEPGRLGVLVVNRNTEFAPVKNVNVPEQTSFGFSKGPLADTPAYAC